MTLQSLSFNLSDLAPALNNHLWQSTLFLLAAALLTLTMRRNHARTRYWLWLAASVKFLIPFALLITLGSHLAKPRATPPTQAAVYYAMEEVSQPFTLPTIPIASPTPAAANPTHLLPILIAAIWLTGFLTVLTFWLVYWRRISAVIRTATPRNEGRELELLRRLEHLLSSPYSLGPRPSSRPIQFLLSPTTLGPGIYGIARPILIWPEGISHRLSDAHLESIFAHEICHVRRRDNLTAALHMLVEAIFWFHPLVWVLGARLEAERERACDESVLALTTQPHIYAESILKICEFYVESPLPCVSGVTGADLKKRITDILDKHSTLNLSLAKKLLLAVAILAAITVPVLSGQANAMQRLTSLIDTSPRQVAAASFATPVAAEQAPTTGPQDAPPPEPLGPSFEVASIRPATKDGRNWTGFQLTPGGRFTTSQVGVTSLVSFSYGAKPLNTQVLGGPKWADSDQFDITAKVDDAQMTGWDKLSDLERMNKVKPMIRALLAERFHLKLHTEMRVMQVDVLVQAKGGAKLKKVAAPPPTATSPEGQARADADRAAGKAPTGGFGMSGSTWTGNACSMGILAAEIGGNSGDDRPVVDQTGLKGYYDFIFKQSHDDNGPTFEQQLEDQLGLKLEPRKVPIETYIIDSVDKPSIDGAELPGPPTAALKPVAFVQERQAGAPPAASSLPTANAPYVPTMTFDVASVRVASETNLHVMMGGQFTPHTTHLRWTWTIEGVLNMAYGVSQFQLVGLPDWLTVFTIEAKGDADADAKMATLTKEQQLAEQQHMLQALLADRFKLKTHWETKEGDTYNLVVAKGGPKLGAEGSMPPSADVVKIFGDRPVPILRQVAYDGKPAWVAHDCSMENWASLLTSMFGRPVTDKTGLTGKYDFELKYKGRTDSDRSADDTDPTPPMDRALQEELGLKVEGAKGPVKVLIIDHIEMPSPN